MNHSISTIFDGSQWGRLLQNTTETTSTDATHGTLNVDNDTFNVKILNPDTKQEITLNLKDIVSISKEILQTKCKDSTSLKDLKAGLRHLDKQLNSIVLERKLQDSEVFFVTIDFYLAKREFSKEINVRLQNYKNFFQTVEQKSSEETLSILSDMLMNASQLDKETIGQLKEFIFKKEGDKESFFELLMKGEKANPIFDAVINIVGEEIRPDDPYIKTDPNKRSQMVNHATADTMKRYDYIFLKVEDLSEQVIKQADKCYQACKIPFDYSIQAEFANSGKYQQWLKLRQESSTTLVAQNADKMIARWNKAEKKRSDYVQQDREKSKDSLYKIRFDIDRARILHKFLCTDEVDNPGEFRKHEAYTTGWRHVYCRAHFVEDRMFNFMSWLNGGIEQCENGQLNPIILAAQAYQRCVSIHPFENGNGRISRMMMDYVLERFNLPPPILGKDILDGVFPLEPRPNHEPFVQKIIKGIEKSKNTLTS